MRIRQPFLLLTALSLLHTGCDNETALAPFTPVIFLEDFQDVGNGVPVTIPGWTNYSPDGISWNGEIFSGNGYATIGNVTNGVVTAWLISPSINIDAAEAMAFRSAQHHLSQPDTLEVFIATDYAGDMATATWQPLGASVADYNDQWYNFMDSGSVILAGYSGTVHFAFKATITEGGGAYFIDNVKVY